MLFALLRSPPRLRFRMAAAGVLSTGHSCPSLISMAASVNTNRLINEKSPYLLQHAKNPVNWYPWGEEAFKKAKDENRPIFLSVGYSTCHWCHVMERESFENEGIAALLNENFVNIKVDREERPDVDKLYMAFIQAISGGGGWPMSVFLTPDLEPITGGTYFPPDDAYQRPGFASILKMVADKWRTERETIRGQGKMFANALKKALKQDVVEVPAVDHVAHSCYRHLADIFDETFKGFGQAPKFPKPVDLEFLLNFYAGNKRTTEGKNALKMVGETLEAMARGGIHDHIGGGFHRYAVDRTWHVPHFEKMLYDQAQLLVVYSNYSMITGEHKNIVEDIAAYVEENLTHPEGGFFSAEDADSFPFEGAKKKREGAFYVWTEDEIDKLLGDTKIRGNSELTVADVFKEYFFVKKSGNAPPYTDPHEELKLQNILIMKDSHKSYASKFKITEDELREVIENAKKVLRDARAKRPRPHLDDKMLTCWNGLMISGLSRASIALDRPDYADRALKAVSFIKHRLRSSSGCLLRSTYAAQNGEIQQTVEPIKAFADDYVFLIQGLLDLDEVTLDTSLLQFAHELQKEFDSRFWDEKNNAGYFLSEEDPSILIRMMEDQDGAEPSANSVAAANLLRLAGIFDKPAYREKAYKIFRGAAQRLERYSFILPKMVTALQWYDEPGKQIIVVGESEDAATKEMTKIINKHFIPNKCFLVLDKNKDEWIQKENGHLSSLMSSSEQPAVFICENFACSLPLKTTDDLKAKLDSIT